MNLEQVQFILADKWVMVPALQIKKVSEQLLSLCKFYRFDPAFILSVIQVESGFKSTALSPAGAVGLMQLMPATANVVVRDMSLPLDSKIMKRLETGRNVQDHIQTLSRQLLMDPIINMTLGMAYLSFLRERYQKMHPFYLLAAYNMGPARMDELISRKTFKPDKTKKYFEAIRQGISHFRAYRKADDAGV